MSQTISGIFEPFAQYVRLQLDIRKTILSNPIGSKIGYRIFNNPDSEWNPNSFTPDENISKIAPIPYQMDTEGRVKATVFEKGQGFRTKTRFLPEEYFFTYTVEKQAMIRMMSGVDLKPEEFQTDGLLASSYEKKHYPKEGMAKHFVLESGTQHLNTKWGSREPREGFPDVDMGGTGDRGYSYGDEAIRANPDEDFGAVPMPGIIDAEIRTKSDDGALREAKVNFVAHNRRQLEALELLYMRPGYPVALEWGWSPYISNYGEREINTFSIYEEFMQGTIGMNALNDRIRLYKRQSGGNYDGFIGFIKNFHFKVREDGGYDCTTEIMAHGEILESLKFSKIAVERNSRAGHMQYNDVRSSEVIDKFLYYLRSLKYNLDKEGDQYFYQNFHKPGKTEEICPSYHPETNALWVDTVEKHLSEPNTLPKVRYTSYLCQYNDGELYYITTHKDISKRIEKTNSASFAAYVTSERKEHDDWYVQRPKGEVAESLDISYNKYHRIELNKTAQIYKQGFEDIVQLYSFIAKVPYGDVWSSLENMQIGIGYSGNSEDSLHMEVGGKPKNVNEIYGGGGSLYWDTNAGIGLQSMLGGTVLKQVSRVKTMTKFDSGYRKDVYIRWDLVCQVINHLSTANPKRFKKSWQKFTTVSYDPGEWNVAMTGDPLANAYYESDFIAGEAPADLNPDTIHRPAGDPTHGSTTSHINNYFNEASIIDKLHEPLVEMTYINPGADTWSNTDPNKGITEWGGRYFYLPYAAPMKMGIDPPIEDIEKEILIQGGQQRGNIYDVENQTTIELNIGSPDSPGLQIPMGSEVMGYHPIIGHSYDINVAIMPHSPIFDTLYSEGRLWFDTDIHDYGHNRWSNVVKHANWLNHGTGTHEIHGEDEFVYYDSTNEKMFNEVNDDRSAGKHVWNRSPNETADSSRNPNVLNVGYRTFTSYYAYPGSDNQLTQEDLNGIDDTGAVFLQSQIEEMEAHTTNGPTTQRNSIGLIYLNLEFLIDTYESMRLKKVTEKSSDEGATVILDPSFNMFDYVKAIWDGVNGACGGIYDFRIHSEHEKPNKIRIIDFQMQGKPSDRIYTFEPQGLRSVTRDFYFDSKISNEMSSTISIAAQAPNMATSLDQLSFKAFHQNIQSRFSDNEFLEEEISTFVSMSEASLQQDLRRLTEIEVGLYIYMQKLNTSNWVRYNKEHAFNKFTPNTAISAVSELAHLINSVRHRYPLVNEAGQPHEKRGQYRPGTSNMTSAIIPLQFNIKLDGIAGILPLQIFKIDPKRLPKAYQRPDICFVVKSESHTVTSGQDWTVDVTGQLALLSNNMNDEGTNPRTEYEEIRNPGTVTPSPEDWINPYIGEFPRSSDMPYRWLSQWDSYGKYHSGLDIATPDGTELVAPRDGKILLAEGLDGYGFTIIMEFDVPFEGLYQEDLVKWPWSNNGREDFGKMHCVRNGEPYRFEIYARDNFEEDMTRRNSRGEAYKPVARALFGHLQTIDVTVGQEVKQGEKIGKTGKTHTSAGTNTNGMSAHLHYELGTDEAWTSDYWDIRDNYFPDVKKTFHRGGPWPGWTEKWPVDNDGNDVPADEVTTIEESDNEMKKRTSQCTKMYRCKGWLFDVKRFIDYPNNFR